MVVEQVPHPGPGRQLRQDPGRPRPPRPRRPCTRAAVQPAVDDQEPRLLLRVRAQLADRQQDPHQHPAADRWLQGRHDAGPERAEQLGDQAARGPALDQADDQRAAGVEPEERRHAGHGVEQALRAAANSKDNTRTTQPIFTSYIAYGASTWKLFPLLTALAIGIKPDYKLEHLPTRRRQVLHRRRTCTARYCTDAQETVNSTESTYNPTESLQSATAKSSNTYFVALADQLFNCNLQPIVEMAQRLGMKALDQPSGRRQVHATPRTSSTTSSAVDAHPGQRSRPARWR